MAPDKQDSAYDQALRKFTKEMPDITINQCSAAQLEKLFSLNNEQLTKYMSNSSELWFAPKALGARFDDAQIESICKGFIKALYELYATLQRIGPLHLFQFSPLCALSIKSPQILIEPINKQGPLLPVVVEPSAANLLAARHYCFQGGDSQTQETIRFIETTNPPQPENCANLSLVLYLFYTAHSQFPLIKNSVDQIANENNVPIQLRELDLATALDAAIQRSYVGEYHPANPQMSFHTNDLDQNGKKIAVYSALRTPAKIGQTNVMDYVSHPPVCSMYLERPLI